MPLKHSSGCALASSVSVKPPGRDAVPPTTSRGAKPPGTPAADAGRTSCETIVPPSSKHAATTRSECLQEFIGILPSPFARTCTRTGQEYTIPRKIARRRSLMFGRALTELRISPILGLLNDRSVSSPPERNDLRGPPLVCALRSRRARAPRLSGHHASAALRALGSAPSPSHRDGLSRSQADL